MKKSCSYILFIIKFYKIILLIKYNLRDQFDIKSDIIFFIRKLYFFRSISKTE